MGELPCRVMINKPLLTSNLCSCQGGQPVAQGGTGNLATRSIREFFSTNLSFYSTPFLTPELGNSLLSEHKVKKHKNQKPVAIIFQDSVWIQHISQPSFYFYHLRPPPSKCYPQLLLWINDKNDSKCPTLHDVKRKRQHLCLSKLCRRILEQVGGEDAVIIGVEEPLHGRGWNAGWEKMLTLEHK